jgi:hypothetical protein
MVCGWESHGFQEGTTAVKLAQDIKLVVLE